MLGVRTTTFGIVYRSIFVLRRAFASSADTRARAHDRSRNTFPPRARARDGATRPTTRATTTATTTTTTVTMAMPAVTARAIERAMATREGGAKKNRGARIAKPSIDATIVGGACVVALAERARAVLAGDVPSGGGSAVDGYFNSGAR